MSAPTLARTGFFFVRLCRRFYVNDFLFRHGEFSQLREEIIEPVDTLGGVKNVHWEKHFELRFFFEIRGRTVDCTLCEKVYPIFFMCDSHAVNSKLIALQCQQDFLICLMPRKIKKDRNAKGLSLTKMIRVLVNDRQMSLRAIANEMGMGYDAIYAWYTGRRRKSINPHNIVARHLLSMLGGNK